MSIKDLYIKYFFSNDFNFKGATLVIISELDICGFLILKVVFHKTASSEPASYSSFVNGDW